MIITIVPLFFLLNIPTAFFIVSWMFEQFSFGRTTLLSIPDNWEGLIATIFIVGIIIFAAEFICIVIIFAFMSPFILVI